MPSAPHTHSLKNTTRDTSNPDQPLHQASAGPDFCFSQSVSLSLLRENPLLSLRCLSAARYQGCRYLLSALPLSALPLSMPSSAPAPFLALLFEAPSFEALPSVPFFAAEDAQSGLTPSEPEEWPARMPEDVAS